MVQEENSTCSRPPLIAAVAMGFGHLRAAQALADEFGVQVTRADRAPLATRWETPIWRLSRRFYEGLSRASQGGAAAFLTKTLLEWITHIDGKGNKAPYSTGSTAIHILDFLVRNGFCSTAIDKAVSARAPFISTFFVPALAASALGYENAWCVVTDTDVSRAWVPADPEITSLRYLSPSWQATRRLMGYGVPGRSILTTGYPLPGELLGGRDLSALRRNLAQRLARIDPNHHFLSELREEPARELGYSPTPPSGPLRLTIALGGAGAQARLVENILTALRPGVDEGRFVVHLVVGLHSGSSSTFASLARRYGFDNESVEISCAEDLPSYFTSFNRTLAATDVLWTKPSELSFFAALGIPLLLAPPVGSQERRNREYLLARGVALDAVDPVQIGTLLDSCLGSGTLARLAWNGYRRMPKRGLYRILDSVRAEQ